MAYQCKLQEQQQGKLPVAWEPKLPHRNPQPQPGSMNAPQPHMSARQHVGCRVNTNQCLRLHKATLNAQVGKKSLGNVLLPTTAGVVHWNSGCICTSRCLSEVDRCLLIEELHQDLYPQIQSGLTVENPQLESWKGWIWIL